MNHTTTHQQTQAEIAPARRTWFGFGIKLLLSIGLLAIIARSIDFDEFGASISSIDPRLFLLSVLLFFPAQLLAAYRWYVLLRGLDQPVLFRVVLRHTIFGQFTTLFLPGQISGDIARTISISRGKQGKALFALSVMLDKVLLLAAIAGLALYGTVTSAHLSGFIGLIVAAACLLLAAVIVSIALTWYRPSNLYLGNSKVVQKLPQAARERILSFEANLKAPRLSPSLVGRMFVLAIALQLLNALGGFMLLQAMNMPIDFIGWIAISSIVSVVQVLPISINGLGVREGMFGSILALYGVSLATSTAFSLISFVCSSILIACSWLASETLLKRGTDHE